MCCMAFSRVSPRLLQRRSERSPCIFSTYARLISLLLLPKEIWTTDGQRRRCWVWKKSFFSPILTFNPVNTFKKRKLKEVLNTTTTCSFVSKSGALIHRCGPYYERTDKIWPKKLPIWDSSLRSNLSFYNSKVSYLYHFGNLVKLAALQWNFMKFF